MTDEGAKRDRFLRVAERRTREILHKVKLLGNCSNRSAYEYSQREIDQIFQAIEEELRIAKARFGQRPDFRLGKDRS